MVASLLNKDFAQVNSLAPRTVKEAIAKGQPIEMVSRVAGIEIVYAQVEFDLIKALSLLNLNLNVKEQQYPFIVRELVDMFSNESIEDFQLCFKKGITGAYGTIYNVDLSVLARWMGEYLDEKYQVIETMQPEESKECIPDIDYQKFKERRNAELQAKQDTRSIDDIRKSQLKEMQYTPPTEDYVRMTELKREWGRKYHDLITGNKTEDWVSFEEWITKQ